MLTCLPCAKRIDGSLRSGDPEDDGDRSSETASAAPTPSNKSPIDRIIRLAAKCNPPCAGRNYVDSERFRGSYRRAENLNQAERKLKSFLSGSCTPASASGRTESACFAEEDEEEEKEWVAQVEPGVLITFVSMVHGANDLKKIRFSRDLFDKAGAQRWWAENYDKVMELYNVRKSHRHSNPKAPENNEVSDTEQQPSVPNETLSSMEASARSSGSDQEESEWVEQDEPGVYITIGVSSTGTRELRRVRFSRDRFEETQARLWWEENKARIQRRYL